MRAVAIIEYLADSPRRHTGVREIARHLGIGPAAAQRLVTTLAECGVLTKDGSEGYRFADDFLRLTRRISARYSLVELAEPALHELAAATNETALFAEYDPARRQVMFTTMVESMHPVRYVAELHRWMPIHRAASGIAVMAHVLADQLEDAWAHAEDELRSGISPWLDRGQLETTLAKIREQGYAITSGQRVSGAVGIFAPIRTTVGEPVGDIGLNIPVHRFDPAREAELATTVLHAARVIEARIR